jgi:hypothetical protein
VQSWDVMPETGDESQDAAWRWTRLMRRGDFEGAWRISDALMAARGGAPVDHLPRHQQPVWDGTPLAGKRVLIRCYHGLGDTLQFIRYAPMLRAVAAGVDVWAQPELVPLLRTADGIDRLIPLHDGPPPEGYDAHVEVMELPHVFRTTERTVPGRVPYVHVAAARLPPSERLAVGLVWQAGDWDDRRSIPVSLLQPLRFIPGVDLHVLQRGPALQERPAGFGVDAGSEDVLETARMMRALDVVVTVDSMPAHLAGALGVRTWTLLHSDCDWRWRDEGDRTPWYPTMRLFRQQRMGEWEPVIDRLAAQLRRVAAHKARAAA